MTFKKTPKQIEATRLHADKTLHNMLYGGSRSGKTFISMRNIILRALSCQSRHLVLRLHLNHVITSIWHDTLPKVLATCFPNLEFKLNKSAHYIEFYNGSQIWFGGLDSKDRAEKILGNEYSTIYLNESSLLSWDAVGKAITRLAEKNKLNLKMFYDCNPPSKSHWTYKVFIEKVDPITNRTLKHPDDYSSILMNPKDNEENLGEGYIDRMLGSLSEKDRLRFECGEFLSDTEGALWSNDLVIQAEGLDPFETNNIVVAVDPAVTNTETSDLTGIIVVETNGVQANVVNDLSIKASPLDWAKRVVYAYYTYNANYIVVETNQGGDLVKSVLKSVDSNLPIKEVRASRGKKARAEPILTLYEQLKVCHLSNEEHLKRFGFNRKNNLSYLKQELTEYVPESSSKSPDRLDALVWALTYSILMRKQHRAFTI